MIKYLYSRTFRNQSKFLANYQLIGEGFIDAELEQLTPALKNHFEIYGLNGVMDCLTIFKKSKRSPELMIKELFFVHLLLDCKEIKISESNIMVRLREISEEAQTFVENEQKKTKGSVRKIENVLLDA